MNTRSILAAAAIMLAAASSPSLAQSADKAARPAANRPAPNWAHDCAAPTDCRAEAITRFEDGRQLIRMWVSKGPGNSFYLGAVLPLGLHIPNGVILSFDKGRTADFKLRLLDCKQAGCRAVAPLSPSLEQRLRREIFVAVVIRDSESRKDIALNMPLIGFSKSLDKLKGS